MGKAGRRQKWKWLPSLASLSDGTSPSLLMSLSRLSSSYCCKQSDGGDSFKTEKCVGVTWTPRSWTICSARKPFIDRLQALAAIHGFGELPQRAGRPQESIWIVTVSPQAWRSVGGHGDRPQIEVKPATGGTVWCVETETGTIVTRGGVGYGYGQLPDGRSGNSLKP